MKGEPGTLRRGVLLGCVAVPVSIWLQQTARALERDSGPGARLQLTNIHTGEVLSVTIPTGGEIDPGTRARLQHLLRDYRRNEEHEMDPGLFVQLTDLARQAGCPARYDVISGYRSPETNERLHAAGHAVADHSLHMQGRAIDVRLEGCPLSRLHELALTAKRGGVGYYPRSGFVHIDTGRARSWEE